MCQFVTVSSCNSVRYFKPTETFGQCGPSNTKWRLHTGRKFRVMKRGRITLAKPQRDINVISVEINDLIFHRNMNVNIREKFPKPIQAQHHPLSSVGREDADNQRVGFPLPEGRHWWRSLAITARRTLGANSVVPAPSASKHG